MQLDVLSMQWRFDAKSRFEGIRILALGHFKIVARHYRTRGDYRTLGRRKPKDNLPLIFSLDVERNCYLRGAHSRTYW